MKTFNTVRNICVLLYGFSFFPRVNVHIFTKHNWSGSGQNYRWAENTGCIWGLGSHLNKYRPFQKLIAWFYFSGSCWSDLTAVKIILISTWREWLVHREGFSLFLARVGMHCVLLPFRLADYFAAGNNKQRRKQRFVHSLLTFIQRKNIPWISCFLHYVWKWDMWKHFEREKSPTITKLQDNPECSQGQKEIYSD